VGAIYAVQAGLEVNQVALFVALMWIGSLVLQYPIGWLSDRMDRQLLILFLTLFGAAACLIGYNAQEAFLPLMIAAFLVGGVASPLYSLFVAHTNDFLKADEMASAAGGLLLCLALAPLSVP